MKRLSFHIAMLSLPLIGACQSANIENINPVDIPVSGQIEITQYAVDKTTSQNCYIKGELIYEYGEEFVSEAEVLLLGTNTIVETDFNGQFQLKNIPPGNYTLQIIEDKTNTCTIEMNLEAGNQIFFDAIISKYADVKDLKPIIYIYPEKEMEVEVNLTYDGELTTTYPKYPENGWKVNAEPDGTLTDENGREYYALYWEGKPRKPLEMTEGFVVSKEQTTEFLEEKLELLGLKAKEANEFIIFWLPILEKNEYNLISFAGEDYLEQAKLNISPTPDTEIRICMVFQGLDEEIDFPIQDLTPLLKTRKGFTVVEWGGQQLPKAYKLAMK